MRPYVIVGSSEMALFEGLVNDAIVDGYVPQGGPTLDVNYDDSGHESSRFMQAMYKKPATPRARKVGALDCPPHVTDLVWLNYIKMRSEKGAGIKATTYTAVLAKLARWHDDGQDLDAIIQQSIDNGWTGLFIPKKTPAKYEKPDVYSQAFETYDPQAKVVIPAGINPYEDAS